jgi:hypothetical protein
MQLEVRLIVAALVVVAICLTVAFVRIARAIRKEHVARFSRIERRLEQDANTLVDPLLRRDR